MKLLQMSYFIEIVDSESLSKAAEKLYISQPSLSLSLQSLEDELGVKLLIRDKRGIFLTEAGSVFYANARKLVKEAAQLKELISIYSEMKKGTLNIGILWIAGYVGILKLIDDYFENFPQLSKNLDMDGSVNLLKKVLDHEIDCAFIISNQETLEHYPNLNYKKLIEDDYVIVMSSKNPLRKYKTINLKDLDGQNIVMPARDSPLKELIENEFSKNNIQVNVVSNTTHSDTVMLLAANNIAVGFSSRGVAEYYKDSGAIVRPFIPALKREIYYISLKEIENYPTIKSFSNYVFKHYNNY